MGLEETNKQWRLFAQSCGGGESHARDLVLTACAVLHAKKSDAERMEAFREDTRLTELKMRLVALEPVLGIATADAAACVRWIMSACFCIVARA